MNLIDENNNGLRKKLQNIIDKYGNDNDIGEQIIEIEKIKEKYKHEIKIIERWDPLTPKRDQYRCYSYALGMIQKCDIEINLEKDTRYRFIKKDSEDFIQCLIKWGYLKQKNLEGNNDEDIIMYFDKYEIKHAGKIKGNKVWSKWGNIHIWEHKVYEVPITYGDDYKIYNKIGHKTCGNAFLQYAKFRGYNG